MDLLTLAIIAFVISVVAGAVGFSGAARGAAVAARILFGVFLIITLALMVLFLRGAGALV